ncbi:MAG: hypothetical protein SNH18_10355 [Rikenellaceae bacterium]
MTHLQKYYESYPKKTALSALIATRCEVSHSTALNWLRGFFRPRLTEQTEMIASITGISPAMLFEEVTE